MVVAEQIIGRERELASLTAFLDTAGAESVAAFVLAGDAGIGKTTLWRAAVDDARARGFHVLACRPAESEARLSFAAVGDLLVGVLDEALPALPPPQRRALEIALLRRAGGGAAPNHHAVALGVVAVVRSLASSQPLLLAIDDVQWLDQSSAQVLAFALRRLDRGPTRILLSVRAADRSWVPLALERTFHGEQLRQLELGPLSIGALQAVVQQRLGLTFPRPTLLRLAGVSGGNPFFALELARAIDRSGGRPALTGPLPVPETLARLVLARIDELPERTRKALLEVSALSEPALALFPNEAALTPAIESGLLEVDGERLRFTHPLFASALYTRPNALARRRLHRRLAERVRSEEERARHLALASDSPDAAVAQALDEAARRAHARGAPAAAAELAEHALRLTPPDAVEQRWERTFAAAQHHRQSGDAARARSLLETLLELEPNGDRAARALQALSAIVGGQESNRRALALAEQGLRTARDRHLRARLELDIARCDAGLGDLAEAERHVRAARTLAGRRDPLLRAQVLVDTVFLSFLRGLGVKEGQFRRAGAAVNALEPRSLGEVEAMLLSRQRLAAVLGWSDRPEEARLLYDAAGGLATEQRVDSFLPDALLWRSELECWSGNWDDARRRADEACEVGFETGQPDILAGARAMQAYVAARRGPAHEAEALAKEGLASGERQDELRHVLRNLAVLGFVRLSLGDAPGALGYLEDAENRARESGHLDPNPIGRFHGDLVEALISLGRLDDAEQRLAALEGQARMLERRSLLAVCERCRGLFHAERGDPAGGLAAAERSLALYDALELPFERGRALLVLGLTARRARRRRTAREALERARAVFAALGAGPWVEKVEAEAARIGGRTRAEGLTPTEQRVAALVREGRSNREIAAGLFVTPRTVEKSLSRIYAKLGVHTRGQLASKLAAADPAADPAASGSLPGKVS